MMAASGNVASNDEFHKLLLVVKDLAQQLDENKQATIRLRLHADLLKEQLRIYKCHENDQISGSSSSTTTKTIDELLAERDDLIRENQNLRQENHEMALLLKEYEKGLENSTSMVREYALNASLRTSQLHSDYNEKLNAERVENESLHQSVINAEARLIKISGILRQAYTADHEVDRSVDRALLELQTENRGLRQALGLPAGSPIVDVEKDLIFIANADNSGDQKE